MAFPHMELPSALLNVSLTESISLPKKPLELGQYDYSLTRQLADVLPSSNGGKTPAACLLTASSAFPVRFTIDEFSKRAGITLPTAPIMADRELTSEYLQWRRAAATSQETPEPDWLRELQEYQREVLRPHLNRPDATNEVVIIDEYSYTSKTAIFAAIVALHAGAERAMIIRGHWYEEIAHRQHSLLEYRPLFRNIGKVVYEAYTQLRQTQSR